MKTVAIIQARMSSTRLPRKSIMSIQGKPMILWVLERVKQSKMLDNVVLATSSNKMDKVLVNLGKKNGFDTFIGSEDDVLDRYYKAAIQYNADPIVRITGDCPLIDPKIIDKVVEHFLYNTFDCVINNSDYLPCPIDYYYPEGFEVEVFSFDSLERAWLESVDKYEREHVTLWMLKNLNIGNLEYSKDLSHIHLSVDTKEDLEIVRGIYEKLGDKFSLEDVLKEV